MNTIKEIAISLVVTVIVLAGWSAIRPDQNALRGLTHLSGVAVGTDGLTVSGTATTGTTGTAVAGFNFGTCYAQAVGTTIAASTTATVECQGSTTGGFTALTGVKSGDNVAMTMASTAPATYQGLTILGANGSTTAGSITMKIFNGTGGTFTWTSSASSTFRYRAWR